MTTATWTTTNTCTNDAEFRALIVELQGKFAAIGLVQTSDTGQINTTTATRPATNTAAGYDIWRFNDSLQATAPIYIKIEYGSGNALGYLGMWITVGTGTDGAGTITGTASTRSACYANSTTTVSTWTSYACYKDGFFGLIYKNGSLASGTPADSFAICRTCDGTGAWTATGAAVYTHGSSVNVAANVQALRFASTATAFTKTSGGYCLVPHGYSSTVGGNNPVYLHWMPIPDMVPVLGLCSHVTTQYSLGTFTATLIGSTARTYLTMGNSTSLGYGADVGTTGFCIAMLYE